MSDAEKVINDLEPVASGGIIHSCDVRHHGVLSCCMVLEEGHDRNDAGRRNVDCEFVFPDGKLLDVFGHA